MSTFVSTTLEKRTGATTTVFNPSVITGGVGTLIAPGSYEALAPKITVSSKRNGQDRRVTRFRVSVPQVDDSNPDTPRLVREATAELVVTVPAGFAHDDINDLIGYMMRVCDDSITNFDSILVDGVGVF